MTIVRKVARLGRADAVLLCRAADAPFAAHAWLETRDGSSSAVRVLVGGDTRGCYRALEPSEGRLL